MQTFGTISIEKDLAHSKAFWTVDCEPHVRARLRRVFPRVTTTPGVPIRLSATPENTRELQWFIQRFPMVVSDVGQMEALAAQHREQERRIAELLTSGRALESVELAVAPREYQLLPADLCAVRGGLLLADDVGVGKTCSAIVAMARKGNTPTVVVCPAHLPDHWKKQLAKFAPHLRVHVVRKGTPYKLVKKQGSRIQDLWVDHIPDVIVVTYHKLRGWAEDLAQICRYVVFDEVQMLRSPNTQVYEASKYLSGRAPLRMGLSATPIHNFGAEFYWVADILLPDCLGTRKEFVREWCSNEAGQSGRLADAEDFNRHLVREGIMLRRTRQDAGRELPGLQKIVHTVDSDSIVLDQLKGNAIELAKVVLRHNESFRGERRQAAGEFDMLMRQATGIAKAPYVAEFVRLLIESGEQVLLFGWHRAVYDIWNEKLKDFAPAMYTGSESPTQKRHQLDRFLSKQTPLMIMSLRSGAGVDGVQNVCRTTVFGEFDWSPAVHEQCLGRPYRDGQPDPVTGYFLMSEEGADPVMVEVLGLKLQQLDGLRNASSPLIERVDIGEMHIRRLARAFLERCGVPVPAEESPALEVA